MELKSNAKINIGLHVLNKRKDGFHNIATVFQEINFFDIIKISEAQNFSCKTNIGQIKLWDKGFSFNKTSFSRYSKCKY